MSCAKGRPHEGQTHTGVQRPETSSCARSKVALENAGIPGETEADVSQSTPEPAPETPRTEAPSERANDGSRHETVTQAWERMQAIEDAARAAAAPDSDVGVLDADVPAPGDVAEAPSPPRSPLRARTASERPEVPTLGAMLLEKRLVTEEQLRQAMERQKRTRRRLGRALVEMGFTTQEAVLEALSA